jgi:hypothetical protein
LIQSALAIRKLFFDCHSDTVFILPSLFPQFHTGKMMDVTFEKGTLHFEWSKKLIKKVCFIPNQQCLLTFQFQKKLKSLRVKNVRNQKGQVYPLPFQMEFEKDKIYLFDRFQK